MEPTARPRKVDIVILGRGLLAGTLALLLAERRKRVAWLVEATGTADDDTPITDIDPLLQAMGERLAAIDKCYFITNTRVRGVSVIENAILGAIAEDARYDAPVVMNASQDERYAAYARMMRQPKVTYQGAARIVPTTVKGGWQLEGSVDPLSIPLLAQSAADQLV